MTVHPIYAAVNKPLLLLGVDRAVLMTAVMVGMLTYWVGSLFKIRNWRGFLFGLILAGIIIAIGKIGAAKDPQFVSYLRVSLKLKRRYDAGALRG